MPSSADHRRVAVDRILCSGHGICAQTLPASIALDEWGYPIIVEDHVDADAGALAVKLCPARALFLR
jgi:ferredoxin